MTTHPSGGIPLPGAMPPPGAVPPPGAMPPPPGYGPTGYGPYGPYEPYGQPPGYPPPGYGYGPQPGYGPPPGAWNAPIPPTYYAAPNDPLVSADFAGWWQRNMALLKAAWRPLGLLQLISWGPFLVFATGAEIILAKRVPGLFDPAAATTLDDLDLHDLKPLAIAAVPIVFVLWVLIILVPLANIHVLIQTAIGRPVSIGLALRAALRRILPLLGWTILAGLIALVGFVCCILPGLYVAAAMTVLPVIVMLERGNAIGRAFRLFNASFGATVGRLAAIAAVGFGFNIAASAITSIFRATDPTNPFLVGLVGLISGAFVIAASVFIAPMYLTTYADMRARHEPFSTAYLVPTE